MTRLILIRHGQTKKNISGKLHQAGDLEVLNKKGREQIKKLALKLKTMNPQIIYSSTEKRAQESAKILSQKLNVPLKVIVGMQERNWGDFAGKTWLEIKAVLDQMTLEQRYVYTPPNGESWKEFEYRLVNSIKKTLKENHDKVVVVVSHGGAIRALMPYLLNVPKEESFKYDPANASISMFDYTGGKFIKRLIDDISHLDDL